MPVYWLSIHHHHQQPCLWPSRHHLLPLSILYRYHHLFTLHIQQGPWAQVVNTREGVHLRSYHVMRLGQLGVLLSRAILPTCANWSSFPQLRDCCSSVFNRAPIFLHLSRKPAGTPFWWGHCYLSSISDQYHLSRTIGYHVMHLCCLGDLLSWAILPTCANWSSFP